MWQAYLLGLYVGDMKCVYTSASLTLLIDVSSYDVYTDIVISYGHDVIDIWGIF